MNKTLTLLSLSFALFGYAQGTYADCYDVTGEAKTYSSETGAQQSGFIEYSLTNQQTGEETRLEADINGMVIGTDAQGAIYLTHTTTSNDEDIPFSFVTFNDRAMVVGAPQGCMLPISETITNVVAGTGLTANVSSINLIVNGAINYINQDECAGLPNVFEDISGEICLD